MKKPAKAAATGGWKIDVGGQVYLVALPDQSDALELVEATLKPSRHARPKIVVAIAPEEIVGMRLKHGEVKAYGRPRPQTS
jgi:hypothetical protein